MFKPTRRRGALCAVLLASAALGGVAAGCGDDDDEAGTSQKGSGIRAGTGGKAEKAATAGRAAAKEEGAGKLPKGRTIGIVSILGGIESADRLEATAKLALERQGYKVVTCDGQGDPKKMISCGNSLLDRNVDALFQVAIDTSLIKPVIAKAKAKKVPFIEVGGAVGPGMDGAFYPDEPRAGRVLSDYLMKRMDEVDGDAEISIIDYPAPWAKDRTDELRAAVKQQDKVKIAFNSQTDAANLVQGTKKTVADQITQKKNDLKAFWFAFDTVGQAAGPDVVSKYAGKQFPDRPLVTTFHADLGTTELMRKGAIDVVVDTNYDAGSWMGVDALFQYWANDKPITEVPQPKYPGVGDLFAYKVITKDNLPAPGKYVETPVDVPAYFQAKWKAQFGR